MDYINVKDGIKWGKTVADDKAIACEYIKLACQRHFNDLDKSKNKDYPFKFDPAKAERSIKFIQLLPHVKGKWAREKKKLVSVLTRILMAIMCLYLMVLPQMFLTLKK